MNPREKRAFWISVLARADASELSKFREGLGIPGEWRYLRAPESGLAMVQGRVGGTGQAFNLGEVSVTRCTLELDNGRMGYACVRGRNRQHAEDAALLDALLQDPEWHEQVMTQCIQPMHRRWLKEKENRQREISTTQVDFFTMVRGETE